MPIPALNTISHRQGKVALTITVRVTFDMTGFALLATLTDSGGATINTKTTGAGITIQDGPNGTGTDAVIDYTDGTSKNLDVGAYHLDVIRTGTGVEDDIAQAAWFVS